MPRDLFGDVTRPSISVGSRKWYTLPVSLISHSLVVASVIALPILAPGIMPLIAKDMGAVTLLTSPPTPPAPLRPQPVASQPAVNPNAAPLTAPTGIIAEMGLEAGFENTTGIIDGGIGTISGSVDDGIVAPSPPPTPQDPIRVGGSIRVPVKTRDVSPVYPAIAQAARVEGIVIIEATIGADGRVVDARILRPVQLLDQAALDAVRQWQFTPTLLNGVPVPVVMTVTVRFTLK